MNEEKIFLEKNREKYENINNYLKNVTDSSKKIIDTGFVKDTVGNAAVILLTKKAYEIENYHLLFDKNICAKFLKKFRIKPGESVDHWADNLSKLGDLCYCNSSCNSIHQKIFSDDYDKNKEFIEKIHDYKELLGLLEVIVEIMNRGTNVIPKIIRIKIYRYLGNIDNMNHIMFGGGIVSNTKKIVDVMRAKIDEENKLLDQYMSELEDYSKKIKVINPHLSKNLGNLFELLTKLRKDASEFKEDYLNTVMYYGIMGDNHKYVARNNRLRKIVNFKKIYEDIVMKDNIMNIEELEDYNL